MDIIRLCQHPHVVQLFGASIPHRALVLERCARGHIRQVITSDSNSAALAGRIRTWIDQIVDAMQYVHQMGVIHYDLKPLNVLVTHNWRVKLCDFSHSVVLVKGTEAQSAAQVVR